MEEKERTIEEIQKEYSLVCAEAGQAQYQLFILQKDLEIKNDRLRSLNLEAAAVTAKKKKEQENA
jgi:hypothetical protein